jgi:hypothetical protein
MWITWLKFGAKFALKWLSFQTQSTWTVFRYPADSWGKPRWLTGIRQYLEQREAPRGKSLLLFAHDPID